MTTPPASGAASNQHPHTRDAARLGAALAERYRIERELGAGGMATVYLAEDLKHHRQVAIKVLRPELAAVIGAERFLRETETIAALQHPHILGLIDSKVVTATPEPLTTYRKTVPPAVEDAVLTALQKLPADRFSSAREFAEALEGKGIAIPVSTWRPPGAAPNAFLPVFSADGASLLCRRQRVVLRRRHDPGRPHVGVSGGHLRGKRDDAGRG